MFTFQRLLIWYYRVSYEHTNIVQLPSFICIAEQAYICWESISFFIDSFTSENDQRNTARHNHSLRQHELLKAVTDLSHQKSVFAIILPVKEGELFIVKARGYPWYLNNQVYVKGSPESKEKRVLLEFTKSANQLVKNQLIIEEKRGVYTKEFSNLVKSFYLHL